MSPSRIRFFCPSEPDTLALAEALGRMAWPGLVVSLEGKLGAGKTVFARGFARGLDISEPITSPSYPIIQEYRGRLDFCHMDWYRLGGEDEVLETGAGEYLDSQHVCLVEWPGRARELFDEGCLAIGIEAGPDNLRLITLSDRGGLIHDRLGWPERLPAILRPFLETAII